MTMIMKTRHLLLLLLASVSGSIHHHPADQQHPQEQQEEEDRALQSSTPRVLGDVYECDELFQEVNDPTPRPIGYEIRICVIPSIRTRQRDVVIRSIDEFTFYKEFGSTVQKVVEKGGKENEEELTLVLCVPGQLICSFKARLKNDFFYNADQSVGNVTGSGTISFEFSDDYESGGRRRRRVVEQQEVQLRRSTSSTSTSRRSLIENIPGGFSGTDTVSFIFPVVGLERPKDDPLYAQENNKGWWFTAPGWLKLLVILGALVTATLLCCLCVLCIYSLRSRIEDERKEDEEKRERAMEDNNNNYDDADNGKDNGNIDGAYYYEDPVGEEQAPTNNYGDGDEGEQPGDFDVCFDADDHPGTQELHNAMRYTMQEFPDSEYGPPIYRHVKQQMGDRRYFLVDDEDRPDVWREAAAKELIDLFRKEYEDLQQRM